MTDVNKLFVILKKYLLILSEHQDSFGNERQKRDMTRVMCHGAKTEKLKTTLPQVKNISRNMNKKAESWLEFRILSLKLASHGASCRD